MEYDELRKIVEQYNTYWRELRVYSFHPLPNPFVDGSLQYSMDCQEQLMRGDVINLMVAWGEVINEELNKEIAFVDEQNSTIKQKIERQTKTLRNRRERGTF